MRDLLSKLDRILTESALQNQDDLAAKRKALGDLEADPVASKDPEISAAIDQRRADLEREAKSKGFKEDSKYSPTDDVVGFSVNSEKAYNVVMRQFGDHIDFSEDDGIMYVPEKMWPRVESAAFDADGQGATRVDDDSQDPSTEGDSADFNREGFAIGDAFGISFSEDFEIGAEIVDILEDGIVIELDDDAMNMLVDEGFSYEDGELAEGVAGAQKCWKGFRKVGTKPGTGANAGKRVNDCEKIGEGAVDESGLQYHTGVKKHGKEYMVKAAAAGREGASQKELGALKDKYSKAYKEDSVAEATTPHERFGKFIKQYFGQIYDYGDNGLEYLDNNAPIWARLSNKHNGNIDSMIAKESANVLKQAALELKAVASDLPSELGESGVSEAEYQGRKVQLGKKMAGDVKKSKVYVKNPQGNVVKVNFGDKNMRIKKSNPGARKSFRARHNCANPGPRHKARYWSCRSW